MLVSRILILTNIIMWKFPILREILTLYLYTLFVYVIMSLLIQFQMINSYNKIISTIFRALISLHEPLLGKIRQFIPLLSCLLYTSDAADE